MWSRNPWTRVTLPWRLTTLRVVGMPQMTRTLLIHRIRASQHPRTQTEMVRRELEHCDERIGSVEQENVRRIRELENALRGHPELAKRFLGPNWVMLDLDSIE